MLQEVEWARLTAPEIRAAAARQGALALLPIGSLEQHGPHLPVITDTASASAACVRAARLVAGEMPALVLPGLWTGMSEHHLPFGGTISLEFDELRGVLRGITRSLRAIGFARLLIVNGHGGNVEPLAVAARSLAHEFGMPVVACTPWYLTRARVPDVAETAETPAHACEGETSVMLAIAPELVRRDKFDEAVRQRPEPVPRYDGFSRFWSFSERAPVTGVRGDPRPATPEKGERFLDMQAEALAAAMRDTAMWRKPDPVWTAGRGLGNTAGHADDGST
ncbi:creatininase family protein [Pseudoroseomonas globiformis]|uniref:Creatininase family protein n=1 Tax=Teichococcus globiformis TaxID=2307229 RepID=A0ABV7G7A1_9PROT